MNIQANFFSIHESKLLLKCVKLLLLFVMVILLWQLILIFISIKDMFIRINSNSYKINLNSSESTIPRLIHQMWKNENLSTYPIKNSHNQWKKSYPNYIVRLWTDQDFEELLNKTEYRYLKEVYKSYPYSIQRADLARLIVLHDQGGFYIDLDVFPSKFPLETLRLSNVSFLIPRSYDGKSLINHFLMSQKSSTILHFILQKINYPNFYKRIYFIPYLEVFSKGSLFLTRILENYISLNGNGHHHLWIFSEDVLTDYVIHYQGRSWHQIDGFIINQFDQYKHLFIYILPFAICLIFILFNRKVFLKKFLQ